MAAADELSFGAHCIDSNTLPFTNRQIVIFVAQKPISQLA